MPIQLPRSLFMQVGARSGDGVLPEAATLLASSRAVPVEDGYPFGPYRIHRALHAGNPGTHELMTLEHGEHLLVAVHLEDGTVAFIRRDYMWVHPDHRGHGLGPELGVQFLIEMGCESWTVEQWRGWLNTPSFTVAGFRNRAKVYDGLVRRGIVTPAG